MDICHSSFSGELLDLGLGVRESMQVVLPLKKRIVCCFGEQLVDAKLVTVSNSSLRLRGKKTYNKGVYVQDLPRGNSSFSVFSSTTFSFSSVLLLLSVLCSVQKCSLGACAPGREGMEHPVFCV